MEEKMTLSELQQLIRDSLYLALPDSYWVMAEIAEIKENYSGHCYLELIEKQSDDRNIRARVRAIIWSSRYSFLKSLFENITGESLRTGLKILVRTKVEYHEIYGLSLIISDIDPSFTLGELALKRRQIIERLEQEGIFSMNKELELPLIPSRIAIISSKNAAGYTDFNNHLKNNSYGYVFYTALFDAVMQGAETEDSVTAALDRIAENISLFDLVVIIRGGGSQTDLSWFDNYRIAYHVTQFPIPVLTGIGHDKDLSVTDLVAHLSLKTPTAVADFIIDRVEEAEEHLLEMASTMADIARSVIEKCRNRVDTAGIRLLPLARMKVSETRERLSGLMLSITGTARERIYRAGLVSSSQLSGLMSVTKSVVSIRNTLIDSRQHELQSSTLKEIERKVSLMDSLERSLKILSPDNVLQRGYTITSLNGKILKGMQELKQGDVIDTRFVDGEVKSTVVGKDK